MPRDLAADAAGIGALSEPVRRALYECVVARPSAVGREEAAEAVGVAVHTAKFHLDKLVDEGLLDVEFQRLTGRSGPGAGRPAKLYRRGGREFAVSLPERRYDLVGHILASAYSRAVAGADLDAALRESAAEEGRRVAGRSAVPPGPDLERLGTVLSAQGYEATVDDDDVLQLANCPFDALAQDHTALVCGLNRSFVQGIAEGMACDQLEACLEPEQGRCCVKVSRSRGKMSP